MIREWISGDRICVTIKKMTGKDQEHEVKNMDNEERENMSGQNTNEEVFLMEVM